MNEYFTPITLHLRRSKSLARFQLGLFLLSLVSAQRIWVSGSEIVLIGIGLVGIGLVGIGLVGIGLAVGGCALRMWRSGGWGFATRLRRVGRAGSAPDTWLWLDPERLVPYRKGRALAPWRLERVVYIDRNFVVLRCRRYYEASSTASAANRCRGAVSPPCRALRFITDRWLSRRHLVFATDAIGAATAHRIRLALAQWKPRGDFAAGGNW